MTKRIIATITMMMLLGLALSGQERRKDEYQNFMPKGDISFGVSMNYLDLSSSDSNIMMLLQNFNGKASTFSFEPSFAYTYKDNKAIGGRIKYSTAVAGISSADLSLFSDDLSLSLEDIKADSRGVQFEAFHRSYMGLDKQGRFGLFNDISVSYSKTKSSFSYNAETLDTYSLNEKVRLGIRPGIMIFILNNVSTHVSLGVGGVSYNTTNYMKDGTSVGSRRFTKANFAPDLTDISFGMTIHL